MKTHTYRFGKDCRPVYTFFHKRRKKEKRIFPDFIGESQPYVNVYFEVNRKAGLVAFVGH